jgi:hypothetical protein
MSRRLFLLPIIYLTSNLSLAQALPLPILSNIVNTGLTAGLNSAVNNSIGNLAQSRTVRTNLRVSYIGAANSASDRRFSGSLRSFKTSKANKLLANSIIFSAKIAAGGELEGNISNLEEAKSSTLRLEFPANEGGGEVSCEAKVSRIRKDRAPGVFQISYALDIRWKLDRAGKPVLVVKKGDCKGLIDGELKSTVPYHKKEQKIPVTLLVNQDSQFEVLVARGVTATK